MKSRPAPVSTASAAAIIWSGVGEVKTWPGQAASSMPTPTKPACSGSCPDPPPEISATLPGTSSARRTKRPSPPSVTMSPCAAMKPSRLSVRRVEGSLISFFMRASLGVRTAWQLHLFDMAHERAHDFGDELVELVVAFGAAEVGDLQHEIAGRRPRLGRTHACAVCFSIGREELLALVRGEVADREHRLQMLRGDRHRVGGT